MAEEIPALIGNMTRYPRFAEYASRMDTASLSRRSVDNEKIADHHALLPTENLPSELDADHRIVYEMVAGRMLETFSGNARDMISRPAAVSWSRRAGGPS